MAEFNNTPLDTTQLNQSNVVNQRKPRSYNVNYGSIPTVSLGMGVGEYKRDKDMDFLEALYQPQGIDFQRADLQSGLELTRKFTQNMLSEAAIETLKTPGYIAAVVDRIATGDKDFNNAYLETMDKIKEPTQAHVYRDREATTGNIWQKLSNATYWADQGQTVGTTLALLAPSIGVGGLIAKTAGKFGAGLNASKVIGAAGAGLFSRTAESAMEANNAFQGALNNPERRSEFEIETMAKYKSQVDELNKQRDLLANSITGDVENRDIIESDRMAKMQAIDDQLKNLYGKAKSEVDNTMKYEAGEIASKTFNWNMAMAPVDMLQYAMMLKPLEAFSKGVKDGVKGMSKFVTKPANLAVQMASEGAEEGYQFIANKEAENAVYNEQKMFRDGFGKRMSEYVKDPEFQESVASGGIMGLVFDVAGPVARGAMNKINKAANYIQNSRLSNDPDYIKKVVEEEVSNPTIANAYNNDNLESFERKLDKDFLSYKADKESKEEDSTDLESNYNEVKKRIEKLRQFDTELKGDERFVDNNLVRKQYALAKLQSSILGENIANNEKLLKDEESSINEQSYGMFEIKGRNTLTPQEVDSRKNEAKQLREELRIGQTLINTHKRLIEAAKVNENITKEERKEIIEASTKTIEGLQNKFNEDKKKFSSLIDGKVNESHYTPTNSDKINELAYKVTRDKHQQSMVNGLIARFSAKNESEMNEQELKDKKEYDKKVAESKEELAIRMIESAKDLKEVQAVKKKLDKHKIKSERIEAAYKNKTKLPQITGERAKIVKQSQIKNAIDNAKTADEITSIVKNIDESYFNYDELESLAEYGLRKRLSNFGVDSTYETEIRSEDYDTFHSRLQDRISEIDEIKSNASQYLDKKGISEEEKSNVGQMLKEAKAKYEFLENEVYDREVAEGNKPIVQKPINIEQKKNNSNYKDELSKRKAEIQARMELFEAKDERSKNVAIIKTKIAETEVEKSEILDELSKLKELSATLKSLTKDRINESDFSQIDSIRKEIRDLENLIKSKSSKKTKYGQSVNVKVDRLNAIIRSEFSELNEVAELISELNKEIQQLESIESDLSNKIEYYNNMLQDKTFKDLSLNEITNRINKFEKKRNSVRKILSKFKELLNKLVKLFSNKTNLIEEKIKAYEDYILLNEYKDLSPSELKDLIKSGKSDNYLQMKMQKEKLESELNSLMDNLDIDESKISSQKKAIENLERTLTNIDNNIRYLNELAESELYNINIEFKKAETVNKKNEPVVTKKAETVKKEAKAKVVKEKGKNPNAGKRATGVTVNKKEVTGTISDNFSATGKTMIIPDGKKSANIVESFTIIEPQGEEIVVNEIDLDSDIKKQTFSDELTEDVLNFINETKNVSTSAIQRKFLIGYNRALRIVEELESFGFVSKPNEYGIRSVIKNSEQTKQDSANELMAKQQIEEEYEEQDDFVEYSNSDIEAKKAKIREEWEKELEALNIHGEIISNWEEISKYGNTLDIALKNLIKKQQELNNTLNKRQKEETKDRIIHQYTKEELEAQSEYQEIKKISKLIDNINDSVESKEDFNISPQEHLNFWKQDKSKIENSRSDKNKAGKINAEYDAKLAKLEQSESEPIDAKNPSAKVFSTPLVYADGQPVRNDQGDVVLKPESKGNGGGARILNSSVPNKYYKGKKVVLYIDHSFKSASSATKENLDIVVQTEEDYLAGKKPEMWLRLTGADAQDQALRSYIFDQTKNDKNKVFSTTVDWVGKQSNPIMSTEAKPIADQLRIDGKWSDNVHIVTSTQRADIQFKDNEGNNIYPELMPGQSGFKGYPYVVIKDHNGKWIAEYAKQKDLVDFENKKKYFTTTLRLIGEYLKNDLFKGNADELRNEISKYIYAQMPVYGAKADSITPPKVGKYNKHFAIGATDGGLMIQLPGFNDGKTSYKKNDYKLSLDKKGKIIATQTATGEVYSFEEFTNDYVKRLSNKTPNIANVKNEVDRANFSYYEIDNRELVKKTGHFYDFLADNKVIDTRFHGLKSEDGNVVFTHSPAIRIDSNTKNITEFKKSEEKPSPFKKVSKEKQAELNKELEATEVGTSSVEKMDETDAIGLQSIMSLEDLGIRPIDSLKNDIDYNSATLESFRHNNDIVSSLLVMALQYMDNQVKERGYNDFPEAIGQVKKNLEERYKVYEKFGNMQNINQTQAINEGAMTRSADNLFMAEQIEKFLKYFNETKNEHGIITHIGYSNLIKRKYDELKYSSIIEKDEDFEDNTEGMEAETREAYVANAHYKLDPERSVSARVRRMIGTIQEMKEVTKDGKKYFVKQYTGIGTVKFLDSEVLMNYLLHNLADIQAEDMHDEIKRLAKEDGPLSYAMQAISDKLDNRLKDAKEEYNEFIVALRKQYMEMLTMKYEFPKEKNGKPTVKIISTNRAKSSDIITERWANSFHLKNNAEFQDGGNITISNGVEIAERFNRLNKFVDTTNYAQNFAKILRDAGIAFSEKAALTLEKDFNEKPKSFKRRFGDIPKGVSFKTFMINQFSPMFSAIHAGNSPFINEKSGINNLAFYEGKFDTTAQSSSFKSADGNNYFGFVNPHHQSNEMSKLDNPKYVSELMRDPYMRFNPTLIAFSKFHELSAKSNLTSLEQDDLAKVTDEVKLFKMAYFDASKNDSQGSYARNYEEQSDVEKEITKVAFFLNNGANGAISFNQTKSDKTMFTLNGYLRLDTSRSKYDSKTKTLSLDADTLRKLRQVTVESEISRINHTVDVFEKAKAKYDELIKAGKSDKEAFDKSFTHLLEGKDYVKIKDENGNNKYVLGAGAYFFNIPELNELTSIREKNGKILFDKSEASEITNSIENLVKELVENKIKNWNYIGINELLNDKFDTIEKLAVGFVVNNMISLANQYMLVSGDPASFAKIPSGFSGDIKKDYYKLLESTHSNMFKRLAKDIAPGTEGFWNDESRTYNVLMIEEPTAKVEFTELQKFYNKAYGRIKMADAQVWNTVEEKLKTLLAYGEIPVKTYDKLMAILESGEEFNPSQLKILMKPDKPVIAMRIWNPELGRYEEVYVKMSRYTLIPQLTKNFKNLDRMRIIMEKNKVGMAMPPTAVKIGYRAPVNLLSDGLVDENNLLKDQSLIQSFDRSGFRIQQEVPYDKTKEHVILGSQFLKLITADMINADGSPIMIQVDSVSKDKISGLEAKNLIDSINTETYKRKFNKLISQLGGIDGVTSLLNDVNAIREVMIEESLSQQYSENDIVSLRVLLEGANSQFETPLYFHPMIHKMEALLTAMVKNKVLKRKLPGKSFVQGSMYGFEHMTEELFKGVGGTYDGVIFSKNYDKETGLKSYVNADGKYVHQIMLTMPFKVDKNGKKVPADIKDYQKDGYIDFSKLPKEMLEMMGYRIPTQGYSSMALLEVVGILPEANGDLVIVPPALIAQMGSDFDVDKLYIHWFNYDIKKDGNIYKVDRINNDEFLYRNYVRREFLKNEGVDSEIIEDSDLYYKEKLDAALENNYNNFKKAWKSFRDKVRKEDGSGFNTQLVLEDIYNNEWMPKFREVSSAIINQHSLQEVKEISNDYDLMSFEDFKKLPIEEKLSDKQLENLFMEISHGILGTKEISDRIQVPLDSDAVKDEISKLEQLRGKQPQKSSAEMSVLNDELHSKMVDVQAAGKMGVAIESNAVTSHALSQYAGLYIQNNAVRFDEEKFNDTNGLEKRGNKYHPISNSVNKNNNYTISETLTGAFRLDKSFDFNGNLISSTLVYIQTEAVDNANNGRLHPMNLNLITFDVANLIAKSGYGIEYIGHFLNQPSILEYCKKVAELSRFDDDEKKGFKDKVNELKQEMLAKHGINLLIDEVDNIHEIQSSNITFEEMEKGISDSKNSTIQGNALLNFFIYDAISKNLNDVIRTANVDVKFLGKSVNDVIHKKRSYKDVYSTIIGNGQQLHIKDGKLTTQGAAYEYGINKTQGIFASVLPMTSEIIYGTNGLLDQFEQLIESADKGKSLKVDDIMNLNIAVRDALYAEATKSLIDGDIDAYRQKLLFGKDSLARRLSDYISSLEKEGKPIPLFLRTLTIKLGKNSKEPDLIAHISSKAEKRDTALTKQLDWMKLLNSPKDSIEYKIGFDLFMYATTFGTKRTANDFGRFIPNDFIVKSGLSEHFRNFDFNNNEDLASNFFTQFVQHNFKIAVTVNKKHIKYAENGFVNIDLTKYDEKGLAYPKYIKSYDHGAKFLYVQSSGNTYQRIPLLDKGELNQYDISKQLKLSSVFEADNIKKEETPVEKPIKSKPKTEVQLLQEKYIHKEPWKVIAQLMNSGNNYNKKVAAFFDKHKALLTDLRIEMYDKNNTEHTSVVEDFGTDFGLFDYEKNLILINPTVANNKNIELTLLHEIAHAYTSLMLMNRANLTDEQKKAYDELNEIYNKLKGDKRFEAYGKYFRSLKEFVAGFYGDENFKNKLNGIPYGKKSAFEKILEAILDFFGIKKDSIMEAAMKDIIVMINASSVEQMKYLRDLQNGVINNSIDSDKLIGEKKLSLPKTKQDIIDNLELYSEKLEGITEKDIVNANSKEIGEMLMKICK